MIPMRSSQCQTIGFVCMCLSLHPLVCLLLSHVTNVPEQDMNVWTITSQVLSVVFPEGSGEMSATILLPLLFLFPISSITGNRFSVSFPSLFATAHI